MRTPPQYLRKQMKRARLTALNTRVEAKNGIATQILAQKPFVLFKIITDPDPGTVDARLLEPLSTSLNTIVVKKMEMKLITTLRM